MMQQPSQALRAVATLFSKSQTTIKLHYDINNNNNNDDNNIIKSIIIIIIVDIEQIV